MKTKQELIAQFEDAQRTNVSRMCGVFMEDVPTIIQALKQSEWRRVEDGLPEMKQLVLVYGILHKEVGKDHIEPSIGLVMWNVPMASDCKDEDQYSMWYTKITHWMPLPNNPNI